MTETAAMNALVSAIADEVVTRLLPRIDKISKQVETAVLMAIAEKKERSEWLTLSQVADLLAVSQRTVQRAVKYGRLPPPVNTCGRALRWKRADIEAAQKITKEK